MTALLTRVKRAWRRLSNIGVDHTNRAQGRAAMGTNHFVILASIASLPWVIALAAVDHPASSRAVLGHVVLIAVWMGSLALHRVRLFTIAAVLPLVAAAVQYALLTATFSASAGFALPLLAIGALTFSMLPPRRWLVRLALTVASTAVVAWLLVDARFATPAIPVSDRWIHGAMVGNVATTTFLLFVLAWFNDFYFLRERRRNARLLDDARVAAQTDSLTEVANRRGIAPVLQRAARDGDYSLALADLDRFKRINDRLGHGAGDVVLSHVARTLVDAIGADGVVSRWGGEEFLIVLPATTAAEAVAVMERARAAVEREYGDDGVLEDVTMSVGVAHALRGTGKEAVLRVADALLYEAKAAGRNRVLGGDVPHRGS